MHVISTGKLSSTTADVIGDFWRRVRPMPTSNVIWDHNQQGCATAYVGLHDHMAFSDVSCRGTVRYVTVDQTTPAGDSQANVSNNYQPSDNLQAQNTWCAGWVVVGVLSHPRETQLFKHQQWLDSTSILQWKYCPTGAMGRALDLWSTGRGFKSYSRKKSCITTLGKLFTPMCLCHRAV